MNQLSENNNSRIAKNSAFLYLRTIITMLIGFFTSRIVLDKLGIENYGIYNVVGGVASMFIFLNSTMSVSTTRFITYELGTGKIENLRKIYSQAKIIHYIIAALVFLLIESTGIWLIYHELSIPESRINASFYVLHTAAAGTVLNIISTPDSALVISHEKMKFFAYISMLDSILRLISAYILTFIFSDRLIWYAFFMLLVFGVDRICYWIYCKKKFIETRGRILFSKTIFISMLSFAGWNILGNLALMTREQGITIILNIFTNPMINAARALTTQICNSISTFVFNVRTAVNPQITKSYAEGNLMTMHNLIVFSSLSCFYILLILFIPLFFISEFLFSIWLVEVPEYTIEFFRLSLVGILVYSFSNPLIIGVHATGNIKKFQIVEGIALLMTLPLVYVLLKMGFKPTSAYLSLIIINVLTLVCDIYIILPIIKFSFSKYFKIVVGQSIKVFILSMVVPGILYIINEISPFRFYSFIVTFLSGLSTIIVIYVFGLTKTQKNKLFYLLRNKN